MIKKNFWRNIHLYLGLLAGLIFFIECLSGALLVFEEEITQMMHPTRFFVPDKGKAALPADVLMTRIAEQIGRKEQVGSLRFYADSRRTVEVNLQQAEKGKEAGDKPEKENRKAAKPAGRRPPAGDVVFVNPYSGMITDRLNPKEPTFFKFMLRVHQSLVLDDIGKTILGISTFVVLIILLTGLVLWWPKTLKVLKTRLKLKTSASWKRLNHDLHVVLGFYCTFFLLIFLITSLPWSFKWANEALYTLTGSAMEKAGAEKPLTDLPQQHVPYQQVLDTAKNRLPDAPYWSLTIPKRGGSVDVSAASTQVYHRNGFDRLRIDLQTGRVTEVTWHHESAAGWQIRRYMKPVHTGVIGGISTKLLAFVVCIISATFPITGLILWLNRIKKKAVKKRKKKYNLESV